MQEYVGYYENGLFHSAGRVLKIPQRKNMRILLDEPAEEMKIVPLKTAEERMASWERLQELGAKIPSDFDYKAEKEKMWEKKRISYKPVQ